MLQNRLLTYLFAFLGVLLVGLFYKWASQRFTRLSNITRHWRFSKPSFGFAIVIVVSALAWLESLHVFSPPAEAEHALAALGVLVGGSWSLYLFVLRKGFESALRIGCVVHTEECADQFIVAIEVVLANIGNRGITAPEARSREPDRGWQNSFDYPADLQIKKLEPSTNVVGPKFANWWYNDGHLLADVENIPAHISLLDGFRTRYGSSEIIEFIMEPGERYELTSVCVLPPGHYIASRVCRREIQWVLVSNEVLQRTYQRILFCSGSTVISSVLTHRGGT